MNRRRRHPDPDTTWTGPAAPNTTPLPERTRFDSLMADPYHVRGDMRLVARAVKRRWLDNAPGAKEALCKVYFGRRWLERDDGLLGHLQAGRRAAVVIAGVRVALEMEQQNMRERYYPADRPMPAGKRGRTRQWWDARDLPRIDSHDWRVDLLSRTAGRFQPVDVTVRILGTDEDGREVATPATVRLVVQDRRVGGPRMFFQCPGCKRPVRYLYAGYHGLTCRQGLRLVYRSSRAGR